MGQWQGQPKCQCSHQGRACLSLKDALWWFQTPPDLFSYSVLTYTICCDFCFWQRPKFRSRRYSLIWNCGRRFLTQPTVGHGHRDWFSTGLCAYSPYLAFNVLLQFMNVCVCSYVCFFLSVPTLPCARVNLIDCSLSSFLLVSLLAYIPLVNMSLQPPCFTGCVVLSVHWNFHSKATNSPIKSPLYFSSTATAIFLTYPKGRSNVIDLP